MTLENNNKSKWPSNVWFNGILCASLNIIPAFINPLALVLSATASAVIAYNNLCDLAIQDKTTMTEEQKTIYDNDMSKKRSLAFGRAIGSIAGISLATVIIATGIIDHLKTTSTLTPINNVTELANPSPNVSLVKSQPSRQLS